MLKRGGVLLVNRPTLVLGLFIEAIDESVLVSVFIVVLSKMLTQPSHCSLNPQIRTSFFILYDLNACCVC